MPPAPPALWNALIRTHHITSRKKVCTLKALAKKESNFVLLRSGSVPGMMYVQGPEGGVQRWVAAVRALRYKDYQLVRKPAPLAPSEPAPPPDESEFAFVEEESVKGFGAHMAARGLSGWWRAGMGYAPGDADDAGGKV